MSMSFSKIDSYLGFAHFIRISHFFQRVGILCLLFSSYVFSIGAQVPTDTLNQNAEPTFHFIDGLKDLKAQAFTCLHASNGITYFGSKGLIFYQNKKIKYSSDAFHCYRKLLNVYEMAEDDLGNIWLGQSDNTIGILHNDSITEYSYNDTLKKYLGRANYFHNIYVEDKSLFTSNLGKGISQVDPWGNWNDSLFIPYPKKDTTDIQLLCLKRGVIAGMTPRHKQINTLRIQLKTSPDAPVQSFYFPFQSIPKYSSTSRVFATQIGKKIFTCVDSRIFQIEGKKAQQTLDLKQPINSITSDQYGRLWVCTGNGAYIYGPADFTKLTNHWFKGEDLLVKGNLEDYEGGSWLISYLKGLIYIPDQRIKLVRGFKGRWKSAISMVVDNENNLLVAINSQTIKKITPEGDTTIHHFPFNQTRRLSRPALYLNPSKNRLWFQRLGENLQLSLSDLSVIKKYPGSDKIIESKSGSVFMISKGIVEEWRSDTLFNRTKAFSWFKPNEVAFGNGDTLFIATQKGLLYSFKNEIHEYTLPEPYNKLPLTSLFQLDSNSIGFQFDGQQNIGFLSKGKFTVFTHPRIKTTFVKTRYIRPNEFYCPGYPSYYFRVSKSDTEIFELPFVTGLPISKQNLGAVFWQNKLWEGFPDGLIAYDSSYVFNRTITPIKFGLSHVKVNDHPFPVQGSYSMPYDQNNFRFIYYSNSFLSYRSLSYRYKMEGINEDWVRTTQNEIQFTSLNPGEYKLHIAATDIENQWKRNTLIIPITILPPFYATWWFRTAWILAALGLVYGIYRFQIRRIKTVNSLREKAVKHQQQALTAQMNPHFIFNSMNSVQQFWLENKQELAMSFMGNFGKLIRRVMEHSAYEYISLQEEIDTLTIYLNLEQGRLEGHFDYVIDVDPSVDPQEAEIPPLLIQPYVENAIWHGIRPLESGGLISIQFSKNARQGILCVIKDNGVGRSKSSNPTAEHQSRGMQKTASRLEILSQRSKEPFSLEIIDLADQHGEETGTEVRFTIPERF